MYINEKIANVAKKVIHNCMGASQGEKVLVVTDSKLMNLGIDFAEAAKQEGFETTLVVAPLTEKGEPSPPVASAMKEAQVEFLITSMSYSHVNARIEASKNGARVASMPTITDWIIEKYLDADYEKIKKSSDELAKMMTEAASIRVVTGKGTDITFSLEGRKGYSDNGVLKQPGAMSNLPAGEAYAAPIENVGTGRVVVDGCISYIGALQQDVIIDIADGWITQISGGEEAEALEAFLEDKDENARGIAEFGIGTNETAEITGHPLVDEKILGTIHIAFGMNKSMGGVRQSDIHYDCIIKNPTVWIDDIMVLETGKHIY